MEKDKKVTIRSIARRLNMSSATVSNVIHGKTKKVSLETVQTVTNELERQKYLPKSAEILLAQNSSKIIGVIINGHKKYEGLALQDPFVSASLNALVLEIEKAGLFMMVRVIQENDMEKICSYASMWNLEGMVLIGFCEQDYQKIRARILIPFVVYDGYFSRPGALKKFRLANLKVDSKKGGRLAAERFRALGCERPLVVSDNDRCMDRERIEGFKEIFPRARLALVPPAKEGRLSFYKENLALLKSADSIFAVSDFYAAELLLFLQENGVAIPADIKIVGFDGSPLAKLCRPTLATIRQDFFGRAALAMQSLKALKSGQCEGMEIVIPVEFEDGKSAS